MALASPNRLFSHKSYSGVPIDPLRTISPASTPSGGSVLSGSF
jgi:hypothetical protein